VDLIVLETKGLKGIRVEGSRLTSSVGRKGIMPMNVEFKALHVTTVRN
ncbi:hypothetical protein A2U01_0113539, partial [Trifolium medium]|nr:hypothetical protein [Trifolium medium]